MRALIILLLCFGMLGCAKKKQDDIYCNSYIIDDEFCKTNNCNPPEDFGWVRGHIIQICYEVGNPYPIRKTDITEVPQLKKELMNEKTETIPRR